MSESTVASVSTLNDAQTIAVSAFIRKCERAMLGMMVIAAIGMLLILAANPIDPNNGPAILALLALIGIYPAVLLGVIWLRTRLGWHLLNAHALWIGVSGGLIISALAVVMSIIATLLRSGTTGGLPFNSVIVLLLVIPLFFAPALRSNTRARAEQERTRFADHWLKLAGLPLWRVFFLLIPHERA